MVCTKCNSENVNVQVTTEAREVKHGRGVVYWLFIGWWLEPLLWIFLTIPRLLIALFVPKRKKIKNETKTYCVCQSCGNRWTI